MLLENLDGELHSGVAFSTAAKRVGDMLSGSDSDKGKLENLAVAAAANAIREVLMRCQTAPPAALLPLLRICVLLLQSTAQRDAFAEKACRLPLSCLCSNRLVCTATSCRAL